MALTHLVGFLCSVSFLTLLQILLALRLPNVKLPFHLYNQAVQQHRSTFCESLRHHYYQRSYWSFWREAIKEKQQWTAALSWNQKASPDSSFFYNTKWWTQGLNHFSVFSLFVQKGQLLFRFPVPKQVRRDINIDPRISPGLFQLGFMVIVWQLSFCLWVSCFINWQFSNKRAFPAIYDLGVVFSRENRQENTKLLHY